MGIYIKEMDMPKSCIECLLHGESACKAFTTIEPWTFKDDERAAFCPLTEVPGPKWIPCSERLPSENGRYLVTYPLLLPEHTWVNILWYGNPTMPNRRVKGKCWYRTDDEWGDVVYDEVTAWMPLPKPYREDGEEWKI